MKKIIKKLLNYFYGKVRYQNLFTRLNQLSLKGMNIGGSGEFSDDGELFILQYLKNELSVLEGSKSLIDSGSIDFIQFEFGGCNIDSRTYFQDFFYLLSPKYNIFRVVKNGLSPINKYSESEEIFLNTNFLAQKK